MNEEVNKIVFGRMSSCVLFILLHSGCFSMERDNVIVILVAVTCVYDYGCTVFLLIITTQENIR